MAFIKSLFKFTLAFALLVCVIFALGAWWPLAAPPPEDRPAQLLISGVNVVDVRAGRILPNHDVLVRNGRIQAVGTGLDAKDAAVLDGRGRYLIPGLFDMHVHSMKLSPVLGHPLFIAAGVTAVRDMGGCLGDEDGWAACAPDKRSWHQAVEAGTLVGPRFDQVTSLAINGGSEVPGGFDRSLGAPDAEGARRRARHDAERGIDFLKPYNRLSRDAYLSLAEAAREEGLYLAGHHPLAIPATEVVAAGQRSIEHALLFIWACYPEIASVRDAEDFRAV